MKKQAKKVEKFGLNALVWREGDMFVAKAVEIEVASQGKSAKEALINLQEALELYFQDEKIHSSLITPLDDLQLAKLFPAIVYA